MSGNGTSPSGGEGAGGGGPTFDQILFKSIQSDPATIIARLISVTCRSDHC